MNKLLESIFETRQFHTSANHTIEISSETSKQQCEYLQAIIRNNNFKKSLEIGFAYGMSTLAITEEIVKNGGDHVVIDKFQFDHWGGHGLDLINQASFSDRVEFIGEFCYIALPKLLEARKRFDFAYIDSTKQFDWLLVDFFYIDKILNINGIIVFDDVSFSGIRKLLRYISQFPNYKIYSQFDNPKPSKKRRLANLLRHLPLAKKYLKEDILKSDIELGINSNCVALIKIDEDKRNWDWHVSF